MKITKLFQKELVFHLAGFSLGILAVAAAAGCLYGSRAFFQAHDHNTEELTAALEERASGRMLNLRNEARIFSKNLGFNILLLPEQQDIGELYARDRSSSFFSSDQTEKLATAKLATLNHLLPMLRERIYWEPFQDEIILMGVEGEIYIKSPGFQKPIEEEVEPGQIRVGNAICQRLGSKAGDKVEISGLSFTVHRLLPAKGNIDDITILMNLGDAQKVLDKQDSISGVLGLSCNCAAGYLKSVLLEVQRIIPRVQVVEFSVRAQARQRARLSIQEESQKELDDIQSSRASIRSQIAEFALLLIGVITISAILFIVALTVGNTRQRRTELAMLCALGLSSRQILMLFISKAALIGLLGSLLGCLAGFILTHLISGAVTALPALFVVEVTLTGVLVSVVASAVPAVRASRQPPADILNQG